jgi:competence protein ComEA
VTVLKSLGLNLLMLLVASGVLFWVLQDVPDHFVEPTAPPREAQGTTRSTLEASLSGSEPADSEAERVGSERLQSPPPDSTSAAVRGSSKTRAAFSRPTAPARRPVTFPLDLNTAKLEDFIELPGIGEKLGQRLVDYRKAHGGFRSVEDLRGVRGIGAKRMERLRPLVVTAGTSPSQTETP